MILIHNGSVYFETEFKNPLNFVVDLKDLIYDDTFILPLNGLYYNFLNNKDIPILNKSTSIRLDSSLHILYFGFTKDKEIYIVLKDKEEIIKVRLPNNFSMMLDDSTRAGELVFYANIKEYKENKFTIEDILKDIYRKTCHQNKNQFAYLSTIEALFFQDLSLIQSFDSFTSDIKVNTLSDLGFISES